MSTPTTRPGRVGEVGAVLEHRGRALHALLGAHGADTRSSVKAGMEKTTSGSTVTRPSASVPRFEMDGEPPRVLAADVEHVVDDHRVRVPVVVPHPVHRIGAEPPQLGGLFPIEGDDAEVGVTRPGIEQRVAVGVEGDRSLDDVAHVERWSGVPPGGGVDEVDVLVVGPEDHLGDAVGPLPHQRLAGPSAAAPDLVRAADRRVAAHRLVGVAPPDGERLRDGAGPVPGARRVAPEHGQPRHRRRTGRPTPPGVGATVVVGGVVVVGRGSSSMPGWPGWAAAPWSLPRPPLPPRPPGCTRRPPSADRASATTTSRRGGGERRMTTVTVGGHRI